MPQHLPDATEKAGLRLHIVGRQWRHIKRISLLIENFGHVASTRIREWLSQIAHFNTFVLVHKNANEPAGVLPQWQNSGSSCVKCYGSCSTAFRPPPKPNSSQSKPRVIGDNHCDELGFVVPTEPLVQRICNVRVVKVTIYGNQTQFMNIQTDKMCSFWAAFI
jgi:hypothetical protein